MLICRVAAAVRAMLTSSCCSRAPYSLCSTSSSRGSSSALSSCSLLLGAPPPSTLLLHSASSLSSSSSSLLFRAVFQGHLGRPAQQQLHSAAARHVVSAAGGGSSNGRHPESPGSAAAAEQQHWQQQPAGSQYAGSTAATDLGSELLDQANQPLPPPPRLLPQQPPQQQPLASGQLSPWDDQAPPHRQGVEGERHEAVLQGADHAQAAHHGGEGLAKGAEVASSEAPPRRQPTTSAQMLAKLAQRRTQSLEASRDKPSVTRSSAVDAAAGSSPSDSSRRSSSTDSIDESSDRSTSSSRSGSSSSSSRSGAPQQPHTAVKAAEAELIPAGTSMALRGAFGGRRPALIPPSAPVSEDVLQWWAEPLGIKPHVLQQWQAGMATVTHPVTHEQVEVLALPYYRAGKLVDVRYLHIAADGQPLGSWLAAEACAPYMLEQQFSTTAAAAAQQQPEQQQPLQPQQGVVEGPRDVVFVSSELDALLLHSIDDTWPVIALTPQRPQWHPSIAAQQQQQQQLRPEDPRLCLTGLQADICKRQQQYELGLQQQHLGRIATTAAAGGDSSSEGLTVSAGVSADASISGLQLLLQLPPSAKDCLAVIALQQSPGGEGATLLQDSLAELLGGVMCRQPLWPSSYGSPAECLMTKRAEAAAAKAAAEAASAGADADAADAAAARAAAAAADAAEVETVCTALQGLAGAHALSGWSLLSLHALRDFVCSGSRDGNPDAVVPDALLNAVLWPITGLERFADYAAEVLEYWDVSNMDQLVHSTGWESLDQYYKVCPGEVTLVTGVPNSGKSEWLDALIVHLAESQGWRFAVCSMEKKPRDHARQLLEKHARKPLLQAAYAEGVQRMSVQELEREFAWLCDHFYVIAAGEDKMPTIDWVLEKARAAVIQYGISGLVIDPYNELDPSRPQHIKEHEHVNQTMAVLRKFARDNKVAVWLVAHPRQFAAQWSGQRPGLQDISGGANFANKADNGIVVHRDWARLKEMQDRAAAAAGAAGRGGGSGKQQQQTQQGAAAGASNSRRRSRRASSGEAQAEEGGDGDEQQQQEGQQRDLTEFEVQIYIEKVRNKTTGSRGECVLYYDRVTGRYKDPRSAEMNPEEEGGDGQQPSQPHPSQQPSQVRAYSSSAAATHNGDSGSIMPVLDGTLSVVAEGEAEAQSAEWDAQQEAAERLAKRAELGRSRGGDEDEEAYLQRQQEASEH